MHITRLVIATGGTGGHIFPALAVAAEAQRRSQACKILFMGGSGPEKELATKAGLQFVSLPAKGILGKGGKAILGSAWILKALWQAGKQLRKFRPELVIGFGGYAGFCPVLSAALLKIPTAIHEQNSVPGATNRILARFAKTIFLSFADEKQIFPASKTLLVGNPVRPDIFQASQQRASARNLLIVGGSQGAKAINDAVIEALPQLQQRKIKLLHQSGKADYSRVCQAYQAAGLDASCVHEFIEDMGAAYSWANLALCRAGASTVFEVAAAGLPTIFIPFPHATHDHQTYNAKALENMGAAILIPQAGLTGSQIDISVGTLLDNPEKLERMASAAQKFAKANAAACIIEHLEKTMIQE